MKFNLNPSFRMQLKSFRTASNSTSFRSPQFTKMPGTGGTGAYGDVSDGGLIPLLCSTLSASEQYRCGYQGGGQNEQPIWCRRCSYIVYVIGENRVVRNELLVSTCRSDDKESWHVCDGKRCPEKYPNPFRAPDGSEIMIYVSQDCGNNKPVLDLEPHMLKIYQQGNVIFKQNLDWFTTEYEKPSYPWG